MKKQCVLALGFFDGVHLGHGGLLRRTRSLADEYGVAAAALTFDAHPNALLRGQPVPLINSAADREWLLRERYGMDELRLLHFDRAAMAQPWEAFVTERLQREYGAIHVVCGHDFRFGAGGVGDPTKLAALCRTCGIGCDCVPEIRMDGQTVSSTLIRTLLEQGEMERAVRFLGHPHILSGTVESGRQLGRTLGIPTANLRLPQGVLLPKNGVYAAKAHFDGQTHLCVVNVGSRPTVSGSGITVEPWILDYDGDLYGHTLRLSFYRFLRPERRFPTLDALKEEILRNAEETKAFFSGR